MNGLAPSMSDEDFRKVFEKYGEVTSANIVKDPITKQSRQFGFVKFADKDPVDLAVRETNGTILEGRQVRVEVSRRSEPRSRPRFGGERFRGDDDRRDR